MKKSRVIILFIISLFMLSFCSPVWMGGRPYWKNELKLGYYNRGFVYFDCPHPPNPIFWTASTRVKDGVQLVYQRLLYDNRGRFGIFVGSDLSRYRSFDQRLFYTVSFYPTLRYWFLRAGYTDFYFEYSVAGPTALSRRVIAKKNGDETIERIDLGAYFIFQDFLGLGFVTGHRHAFSFDVRLVHYSNGDIFPKNPGFDVPVMFYLGYSF